MPCRRCCARCRARDELFWASAETERRRKTRMSLRMCPQFNCKTVTIHRLRNWARVKRICLLQLLKFVRSQLGGFALGSVFLDLFVNLLGFALLAFGDIGFCQLHLRRNLADRARRL